MGFGDFSISMQTRDIITKMIENVVERIRPPYRYGTVTQVDGLIRKCYVIFTGESTAVPVAYGMHAPLVGSQVRVEGIGVDKYITDIIDGARITGENPVRYTAPTMNSPWTNYTAAPTRGYHGVGYTKTSQGIVTLTGLVAGGTSGSVIFTLPVGYRPDAQWAFCVQGSGGNVWCYIKANGDVLTGGAASSGWFSLDGIMFPAAGVATWTPIGSGGSTYSAGWSSFHTSDSNFGVSSFWRDPLGRVWIQGMHKNASPSTLASPSTMFTLPFGKQYISHFPAFAGSGTFGTVLVPAGASTAVQAHQGANSAYVSTARVVLVDSTVRSDWSSLSVHQSGWTAYAAGYPDTQYMKFADGVVMLEGLIKNTAAGTKSTYLVRGASPDVHIQRSLWHSGDMIFCTTGNLLQNRTDLSCDGLNERPYILENGPEFIWRSHAGINFLVGA